MARLGKNQLKFLAGMAGYGRAVIVGDKLIRSLVAADCMRPIAEGSRERGAFFVVTPAGLRAVADAMDAGTLPALTIDDFKPGKKGDC